MPRKGIKMNKSVLQRGIIIILCSCILFSICPVYAFAAENQKERVVRIGVPDDTYDKIYDMILMDIQMPNMDGYELTRQLRKADFNLPILMVTAKETFEDKQEGFSAGTDDYMVKPIDINEMILRVGALLRRSKMASEHSLTVGNCVLDYDAMSVAVDGGAAETIPQMEFKLLFKLLSYPDKIFTRRQLLDELWGMDKDVDERTVDVHVKRLRERYGSCESFDIVTVRGLGYKAVKKQ